MDSPASVSDLGADLLRSAEIVLRSADAGPSGPTSSINLAVMPARNKKLRAVRFGVFFFPANCSPLSLRSGALAVSVGHGCLLLGDAWALSRHFGIQFFVG
jgi:hypothetical protein